tara:strand:- start:332 stop:460 length:129 start_codon:yes stop_codon:yes gene_type:complete
MTVLREGLASIWFKHYWAQDCLTTAVEHLFLEQKAFFKTEIE